MPTSEAGGTVSVLLLTYPHTLFGVLWGTGLMGGDYSLAGWFWAAADSALLGWSRVRTISIKSLTRSPSLPSRSSPDLCD